MTNQKICIKDLEKVKTVINLAKSQETMQDFGKGCIEFDNCSLKEVFYFIISMLVGKTYLARKSEFAYSIACSISRIYTRRDNSSI